MGGANIDTTYSSMNQTKKFVGKMQSDAEKLGGEIQEAKRAIKDPLNRNDENAQQMAVREATENIQKALEKLGAGDKHTTFGVG